MLFESEKLEKLINCVKINNLILFLDFFNTAANLKSVPRQGWIDKLIIENPESVADHVFSMSVIGMILSDSRNFNTEKILKMILLHDLAESITGDITPEEKPVEEKKHLENITMNDIISKLPENLHNQYLEIWEEYQNNETKEADFVHQIDKLEMAIQAKIYEKQATSKRIDPFLNSAKKAINDPILLKLLNQITEK